MKRTGRSRLKALALLTVLVAGSVTAFSQHPLFGELPQAEGLAAIAQLPNYANGRFHNQIDSPLLTTDQSEWSMWIENVVEEKGPLRPPPAF